MESSYYLYLVQSVLGRIGFGIAKDYIERNQFYAGHSGDVLIFPVVWKGWRSHAKSLEKKIKSRLNEHIWKVEKPSGETWTTEWLNKDKDKKF